MTAPRRSGVSLLLADALVLALLIPDVSLAGWRTRA
jgi:hypothetical protein